MPLSSLPEADPIQFLDAPTLPVRLNVPLREASLTLKLRLLQLVRAAFVSIQQLLHHVEQSLDDPSRPRSCPICARVIDTVCAATPQWIVPLMRGQHRPLLLRIMAFLTAERAPSALSELAPIVHAAMRSCPHHLNRLHFVVSTSFQANQSLVLALVGALSSIADQCFGKKLSHVLYARNFRFCDTWPRAAGDLLPTGSIGFKGLIFWLTHSDDVAVLAMFARAFLWNRTAFYTEFSATALGVMLSHSICDRLDAAVARLTTGSFQHSIWSARCDPAAGMGLLVHVVVVLLRHCRVEWPDWRRLFQGCETQLLTSTFSAMTVCGEDEDELYVKDSLRQIALLQYATLQDDAFDAIPDDLVAYIFDEQIRYGSCYGHFRAFLRTLSRRCSGPNCDMGNARSACAVCMAYRYCSKGCQREHWKDASRSHKPACKLLKGILAAAPLSLAPNDFADACDGLGLDISWLSEIYAAVWKDRFPALGDNEDKQFFVTQLTQMELLCELDALLSAERESDAAPAPLHALLRIIQDFIELPTPRHEFKLLYRYLGYRLGSERWDFIVGNPTS